jgi:Family of unknown function (DUF6194)
LTSILHDDVMTNRPPSGPTPDSIRRYILDTYPETDVVEAMDAWFFSLDAEKHWPNYATIVTTDAHDDASDLGRPDVFRLNLGVDRQTFERIAAADAAPDYTALDRLLPHPVYGKQLWISILNPTDDTFRDVVVPLIALAHDRLAAARARHRA